VIPALRRLIHGDLPSGRYEAATLLAPGDPAAGDPAAGDPAVAAPVSA